MTNSQGAVIVSLLIHAGALLSSTFVEQTEYEIASNSTQSIGVELVKKAPKEIEVLNSEARHRHEVKEIVREPEIKKGDLVVPKKPEKKVEKKILKTEPVSHTEEKTSAPESSNSSAAAAPSAVGKAATGEAGTGLRPGFVSASAAYYRNPPPIYPREARENRYEGVVRLEVNVSESGEPSEVKLKTSSGFRILDDSAIKAVRSWKFKPATQLGISVQSQVEVPIRFKLER